MSYSGWDHMGGMGWGMGGGLLGLLFLIAVIAVIVAVSKGYSGWSSGVGAPRTKSPLDVLEERYARGEIGREEFEQKRRDLQ